MLIDGVLSRCDLEEHSGCSDAVGGFIAFCGPPVRSFNSERFLLSGPDSLHRHSFNATVELVNPADATGCTKRSIVQTTNVKLR